MERGDRSPTRRHAAIHANVPRSYGLHSGRDDQCTEDQLRSGFRAPDEPGDALPSARNVRGLREPVADAGRYSFELSARTADQGVSEDGAFGVGRDQSPGWKNRRI